MAFVDKSRIEPTIFLIEKISFSLKLFSGHFYGQSFIKTVRGPLMACWWPMQTVWTKHLAKSGSKLLDILMVFLFFFQEVNKKDSIASITQHAKSKTKYSNR